MNSLLKLIFFKKSCILIRTFYNLPLQFPWIQSEESHTVIIPRFYRPIDFKKASNTLKVVDFFPLIYDVIEIFTIEFLWWRILVYRKKLRIALKRALYNDLWFYKLDAVRGIGNVCANKQNSVDWKVCRSGKYLRGWNRVYLQKSVEQYTQ